MGVYHREAQVMQMVVDVDEVMYYVEEKSMLI
jgi:hypothetical protein